MTLASFLYLIAAIFGLDAALQFIAACAEGISAAHRLADIAFGTLFVTLACTSVHYAAGLV